MKCQSSAFRMPRQTSEGFVIQYNFIGVRGTYMERINTNDIFVSATLANPYGEANILKSDL